MKFVIAKDGSVSSASRKGGLREESVVACATEALLATRFPEPEGGGIAIVSLPLQYESRTSRSSASDTPQLAVRPSR